MSKRLTSPQYLIKTYQYEPSDEYAQQLRDFWVVTAESSIKNIALSPYHRPELTFLSQSDVNGSLMWSMDDYVRRNLSPRCSLLANILLLLGMLRWW